MQVTKACRKATGEGDQAMSEGRSRSQSCERGMHDIPCASTCSRKLSSINILLFEKVLGGGSSPYLVWLIRYGNQILADIR
jgi:hypothetical protein